MPAEALDFKEAVEKLAADPLITKDSEITIVGGEFRARDSNTLEQILEQFLQAWNFSNMNVPYRVWEYVHQIEFTSKNTIPNVSELALLERARLFGEGGDLSLRRDGERFLWHFIGPKGTAMPAGYGEKDFWKENPDVHLRQRDETALLWGDYKEALGRWQEDRVGWAKLDYPTSSAQARRQGKRVEIHYTVFTDGGHTAFVWWKEVKDHG
jgi:hypothetical protein